MTKQFIRVIKPTLNTSILGKNVDLPFGFAPSAMHKLAHPAGEAITATVAYKEAICFTLSTLSTTNLTQSIHLDYLVQQSNQQGIRYFQLYILKDRKIT